MLMTHDPKTTPQNGGGDAEPEITQEESVPSDGKDEVGEKMMEELGRDRGKGDQPKGAVPGMGGAQSALLAARCKQGLRGCSLPPHRREGPQSGPCQPVEEPAVKTAS